MGKITFEPKAGVNEVEFAVQGVGLVTVKSTGLDVDPVKEPLVYAALEGNDSVKRKGKGGNGPSESKEG